MKVGFCTSLSLAASLAVSHSAVTLTNLLGYYDFEGNADNVSGSAPNATLTTDAFISSAGLGYDGVGQSLVINNSSDGALVATGTHFDSAVSADKMAISFWSYDTVSGDNSSSFRAVTSSGDGRGFQAHAPWSNNTIYFDHNGSASGSSVRLQVSPGATPINEWVHWVFQKDGGVKEIWRNGILVGNQASGAAALLPLTGQLYIGSDVDQNLDGRIDEFAIFDEVLSTQQIADLNSGTSVSDLLAPAAIPEPSSAMLMLLGGFAAFLRRR